MAFFWRFLFYFTMSYLILIIPIGHRNVFNRLNEITDPYTDELCDQAKLAAHKTWKKSVEFTKKLFNNANPLEEQDTVSSGQSSWKRSYNVKGASDSDIEKDIKELQTQETKEANAPDVGEVYTAEEQALVDSVMKKEKAR